MRNDWHEWSAVEKIDNKLEELREELLGTGMQKIKTKNWPCSQCGKQMVFKIDRTPVMPDEHRVRLECWGCGDWMFI